MSVTTLGRPLMKEYQGVPTFAPIEPCDPCAEYPTCEDSVLIADDSQLTGFTYVDYTGNSHTITFPSALTPLEAEAAIQTALATYEFDIYVRFIPDGAGNYTVRHRGGGTISELVTTTGVVALTRECNIKTRCKYKLSVGGVIAANTFKAHIASTGTFTAIGPASDLTYGVDSAATVQTALQTAVDTLFTGNNAATVTVTDNTNDSVYTIEISAVQGSEFAIGANEFAECLCKQIFEAA